MENLSQVKELLKNSKRVCVLTGAGVSAESGIPTFRGGGDSAVWKGMPFEKISSAEMVEKDLDAVWEWFDHRRALYKDCLPNAAHRAFTLWQERFEEFTLITQNVDGLHERAGSKEILELHGNINHAKCVDCSEIYRIDPQIVPHQPSECSECGSKLRPDVVLFGEMLPMETFQKAERRSKRCDVFFVVGTSALVYPAIGLADLAKYAGAKLVEVNPEETPMTSFCDFSLCGNAGDIIPLI